MSRSKLNFMERVALEIIYLFCKVIAYAPHWFKYNLLSNAIYFLIYTLLKYRVKVVDKNLRNSFPQKSDAEIVAIRKGFYHYLSEVAVSTIALAGRAPQESIINKDEDSAIGRLRRETAGHSWVALTAHYGLWEYFMFWAGYADQVLVAAYHPLENRLFEELFRRLRNHKNVNTIPLKETIRYCIENRDGIDGRNFVIGLIADQNPPRRPNSEWFKFLNQDSIFFDGGEKIALKLKLPVYFVYQRRISRGRYELDYEMLHDGQESVEPYVITRRYIEKLERVIEQNPELWLWSHRRWKHDPKRWRGRTLS